MLKNISMPVVALALGHLVTDLQAGALPIVLPHLKELFALSYSQLAFIVLTQNITSSYCADAEYNFISYSAAVWLYYR